MPMFRHRSRLRDHVRALLAAVLAVLATLAVLPATSAATPNGATIDRYDGRLDAGGLHTCAIMRAGTVRCWGSNANGQRTVPVAIGAAVQITTGAAHSCAIKSDGTIGCWGAPAATTGIPSGTARQLSAGDGFTCAVGTDGQVDCWGASGAGQTDPSSALGTTEARQVGAGSEHACAIRVSNATVVCWGASSLDRLVAPTTPAADLAVGGLHSCIVTLSRGVSCWGDSSQGQATVPGGLSDVIEVGAGLFHTCALRASGTVTCWGESTANKLAVPTEFAPFVDLAVGDDHACATSVDGTVHCWGDGTANQTTVPAVALSQRGLTAGDTHSCAIDGDGTPQCWGTGSAKTTIPNDLGPVRDLSAGEDLTCAVRAAGPGRCWGALNASSSTPALQMEAGSSMLCFRIASGASRVECAGTGVDPNPLLTTSSPLPGIPASTSDPSMLSVELGGAGACATGQFVACWSRAGARSSVPASVGSGGVLAVDAGGIGASTMWCAVLRNGSVVCWNQGGSQTFSPSGLSAVAISVSGFRACAITATRTVACWTPSGAITVPADLGTVSQIAVGTQHTCAITTAGTPTCFGSNASGQSAVEITNAPPAVLPAGPYAQQLSAQGDGPFALTGGSLPSGLTLTSGGLLSGTPTVDGQSRTFTISPADDGLPTSVSSTFTVTTDLTAPTTTDDLTASWAGSAVTVTLNATDGGGFGVAETTYEILRADGSTSPTSTYSPAAKPVLANGERLRYRSTDVAGNTAADRTSVAARVDVVAPVSDDDLTTQWATAPIPVRLTATDPAGSGVDRITYEIIDAIGSVGPTSEYVDSVRPKVGNGQRIQYRAIDQAGNRESDQLTVVARVDTSVPRTVDSVTTSWSAGPVDVSLSVDEAGSGLATTTYEVLDPDGSVVGGTQTYTGLARPALTHGQRLRYRSVDVAGNQEADRTSLPAKVDSVAPSTTDDVPGGWQPAPVPVTLTATDGSGSGVQQTTYEILRADGSASSTSTYSPAAKPVLANGERLRYRSRDGVGRAEADRTSTAAQVDPTVPVVELLTVPAARSGERAPVVTFSTTAPEATFRCALNGAAPSPCSSAITLGPLADGDYTFTVQATSRAGLSGPAAEVRFTVAQPVLTEQPPGGAAPGGGGSAGSGGSAGAGAGSTPGGAGTPAAPAPVLVLAARLKGKVLLLDRRAIPVTVSCGAAACRLTVTPQLAPRRGKAIKLPALSLTLGAGERRVVRLAITAKQRTAIRKLVGKAGAKATFVLRGEGAGGTATQTVVVDLRRVAAR